MQVGDLMTRAVRICRRTDGLDAAVRMMKESSCGCVVVVDEQKRAVGIVTDRDVCLCSLRTLRPLQLLRVSDAMTAPLRTCRPEEKVSDAESTMGRCQVRRLPVVDADGRLEGILALDDIARQAARDRDLFSRPVTADEVGMTLAKVSRPRILMEEPPPQ
jgi:CBS domain-containing protein